ncbi:MAG: hypothetical protein ABI806_15080 [Candidatus Solibacter sp.]
MLTRRAFLQTATVAAAAPAGEPKRIAILATVYRPLSQAQHLGDRLLVGYPWGGAWHRPDIKVSALYVDQKSQGDLSGERAREFGFQVYPTIAEALRCGGKQLAVDAVLLVAGQGDYASNEKGQVLFPGSDFFQQCVKVFEQDGRAAPVYNANQLSYSFEKSKAMVDAAQRLRFPLLAGSSLPVTWRLPAIELPMGAKIEEALMVGGAGEAMDFHALEGLQCMVERRSGGETGVKAVQLLEGDAVWKAGDEGRYSKALLTSALSRSDTPLGLTEKDGRTQDLVKSGQLQVLAKRPAAYFIEYRDGCKASVLMLDGAIKDCNFAARLSGVPQVQSTQFLMTPEPNLTYSACLMHKVEQMILSGAAPYPVERTLLAGGILESCLTSKVKGHARVETPHLNVVYKAPRLSQFAQA